LTAAERLELKQLYRFIFRDGRNIREAVVAAGSQFTSEPAKTLLGFIAGSKKGVCADISMCGEDDGGAE
jgi:acyl-[acyl carrier protein]--UDP-N-acetylglucosamine O-acyltransferase